MRSGINNVMMASLSLQLAQWNWNPGADTRYLMGDGKTLATSTVVSHHVDLEQPLLIVIRDVDWRIVEDLVALVGLMFTL